ncbi:MAG: TIGR02996 domain-containing protein [Kofleriaceae bacterium]
MASDRTAELFDAVYANLDDDAARLVLADHLSQLGDPRGELIALQCVVEPTAEQHARAEHLLAHHASRWLRAAGLQVVASRYERGFPVAVELTIDPRSAGAPVWRTIREVVLVNQHAAATPLRHPVCACVRVVHHVDPRTLQYLTNQGGPLPYEELSVADTSGAFVWLAQRWTLFPALRRLELTFARDLAAVRSFLSDHPLDRLTIHELLPEHRTLVGPGLRELASRRGIEATWP